MIDLKVQPEDLVFSASQVHDLLTGGNEITEKQQEERSALQLRKEQAAAGTLDEKGKAVKPLTANMEAKLEELTEKANAPFEFGATAKRLIADRWLLLNYGVREPVYVDTMFKGHLAEEDSIELIRKVYKSDGYRTRNTLRKTNAHFTGLCDIDLKWEDAIEDVKSSFTIATFFRVWSAAEQYKTQGMVYCDLYERSEFRLHYCLVDTPPELISQAKFRLYNKFDVWSPDVDNNPEYLDACNDLDRLHKVSHIAPELRVKTFTWDRDDELLAKLRFRVEQARLFYAQLDLNWLPDQI